MNYTASSVKNALMKSKRLIARGLDDLGCPSKGAVWTRESKEPCLQQSPAKCVKAIKQSCIQPIHISYKNSPNTLFAVLEFRFTISPTDFDGFIDEYDESFGKIIAKELINTELLKRI